MKLLLQLVEQLVPHTYHLLVQELLVVVQLDFLLDHPQHQLFGFYIITIV